MRSASADLLLGELPAFQPLMAADHMSDLLAAELRQLSLQSCRNQPNACAWMAAISPTLEELDCSPIDEQLILALAEHCKSLRKLRCQ